MLPATFFTALSLAISADAALVIASNGGNPSVTSSITTDITFDGSGGIDINSNTFRFPATGSVSESGAFGGTIGITLNAMANVSTAPATLGDQLTAGTFNWNSNIMGVQGDPAANGDGIGFGNGSREGITFALNATTGINSAVGFKITKINVQNVGGSGDPLDESFTIVNLLTRQSLEFTSISNPGDFDVSSLNLTMAGGNSGPVAAIYSGDVGGFRFAGLTLEAVPEPTSALLVGVSLLAGCFSRRRSY